MDVSPALSRTPAPAGTRPTAASRSLDPTMASTSTIAPAAKTYDEHRQYLHDLVRLQLWFMWMWAKAHPDEPLGSVLHHRVDLCRKIDIWEGRYPDAAGIEDPIWQALVLQLQILFDRHRVDADARRFERKAFKVVRPAVDRQSRADYEQSEIDGYKCGSLTFDPPEPRTPGRVPFHIANAIRPHSIFADPDYLPGCLTNLMDRAETEHGAQEMWTRSWLNSDPRWLRLFPLE